MTLEEFKLMCISEQITDEEIKHIVLDVIIEKKEDIEDIFMFLSKYRNNLQILDMSLKY